MTVGRSGTCPYRPIYRRGGSRTRRTRRETTMKKIHLQRVAPADIEARSMEIIGQELGERTFPADQPARLSGPSTPAPTLTTPTPGVLPRRGGKGHRRPSRAAAPSSPTPRWPSPGVIKGCWRSSAAKRGASCPTRTWPPEARSGGRPGATVSMERAAALEGPIILAVGNAPTALVRACELIDAGRFHPALVIGVPVGFVNVVGEQGAAAHHGHPPHRGKRPQGGQQHRRRHLQRPAVQASNNERE